MSRLRSVAASDLTGSVSTDGAVEPSGHHAGPVARVLLTLISLYRTTAALRSPRCRFLPTCSAYAAESLELHGATRGSWLAVRRISRCHPWNPGGVDPVPPTRDPLRRSPTRK